MGQQEILELLEVAGEKGVTVHDLCIKTGVNKNSVNNSLEQLKKYGFARSEWIHIFKPNSLGEMQKRRVRIYYIK